MPELHIQRREPALPWWLWLIGALILALLIWWIVAATNTDRELARVAPTERVAGERQVVVIPPDHRIPSDVAPVPEERAVEERPAEVREPITDEQPIAPREPVAGERQEAGDPAGPPAQAEGLLPVPDILQNPGQYHGRTVSGVAMVTEVVSNRGFWVEQNGNSLFVIDGATIPPAGELRPGQQVHLHGWIYQTGARGRMPQVEPMEPVTAKIMADQRVFMHVTEIRPVASPSPQR